MNQILVCTHGQTGVEMVRSLEMVMGDQDNLIGLSYAMNESMEDLRAKFADHVDGQFDSLIFVDIVNGIPFTVAQEFSAMYDNVLVVTGVHIGMLVEVCNSREKSLDDLARLAVDSGKQFIQLHSANN